MRSLVALCLCLQLITLVLGQKNCKCSDCKGQLELGIVLDSSSSISDSSFGKGKEFLKDFIDNFDVGSDGVRVSFISFGRDVHTQDAWSLDKYNSMVDVERAIAAVPHHAQRYTNTGGGIQYMRENQLNNENCRPGIPRVAVVVTDGNSQKGEFTRMQALEARQSGILMFAVGVGHDIIDSELFNIAGDWGRVSRADSYEQLEEVTQQLAMRACKAANLQYMVEKKQEL